MAKSDITSLKHNAVDLGAMHRKYTNGKVTLVTNTPGKGANEPNRKALLDDGNQDYNFFTRKKDEQPAETSYSLMMKKTHFGVPTILKNHGQYAAKMYKMFESLDDSASVVLNQGLKKNPVSKLFVQEGSSNTNSNQGGKGRVELSHGSQKTNEFSRDKHATSSKQADQDKRGENSFSRDTPKIAKGFTPVNKNTNSPSKSRVNKFRDPSLSSEREIIRNKRLEVSKEESTLPGLTQVPRRMDSQKESAPSPSPNRRRESPFKPARQGTLEISKKVEQKPIVSEDLNVPQQEANTNEINLLNQVELAPKSRSTQNSLPRIKLGNSFDRSSSISKKPS